MNTRGGTGLLAGSSVIAAGSNQADLEVGMFEIF
jgi:hypothetical protein